MLDDVSRPDRHVRPFRQDFTLCGYYGARQKIKMLPYSVGNSYLLAWSYFELAQSSVNDQTSHENFRPRLLIGQVTNESCFPERKIYKQLRRGHSKSACFWVFWPKICRKKSKRFPVFEAGPIKTIYTWYFILKSWALGTVQAKL